MGSCSSMSNRKTLFSDLLEPKDKRKRRVLLIGLDSAGKTTILHGLRNGNSLLSSTIPTTGFNVETMKKDKLEITIWDVGGQDKLRNQWRHYYTGVQGLIFVVDSSDRERMPDACSELMTAAMDDQLLSACFLILINKQDAVGAMSVSEVETALGLDSAGETRKAIGDRPLRIKGASALKDEGIQESFDWLCEKMQPL